MKQNKEAKISYWAAHLTTIVSVTLLLIIIGIIAIISICANNETRKLKEQLELTCIMADSIPNEGAKPLYDLISKQPYCAKATLITKEEALKAWTAETGENLEELFGVNPLSPEVTFSLKSDYASEAQIKKITAELEKQPGVETVSAPDSSFVDSMNRNIESLEWLLGGIAIVMVIISFVLINNTVHLVIYSRRFTIHTMQLVGATNGFIRRPFILNNILSALISSVIACGILAGAIAGAENAGINNLTKTISWGELGIVFAGVLVAAMLICGLSALLATTKYLHKDYGELFK